MTMNSSRQFQLNVDKKEQKQRSYTSKLDQSARFKGNIDIALPKLSNNRKVPHKHKPPEERLHYHDGYVKNFIKN